MRQHRLYRLHPALQIAFFSSSSRQDGIGVPAISTTSLKSPTGLKSCSPDRLHALPTGRQVCLVHLPPLWKRGARAKAPLGWRTYLSRIWHLGRGSRICGARGRASHSRSSLRSSGSARRNTAIAQENWAGCPRQFRSDIEPPRRPRRSGRYRRPDTFSWLTGVEGSS